MAALRPVDGYPEIPPDFGHWLAGFADGEGTFLITPQNGGSWMCRFQISLRLDDSAILDEIRERTGLGALEVIRKNNPQAGGQVRWDVRRKRDVARLVELFDAFPLRAKKQRDYLIWRAAVVDWLSVPPYAAPNRRPHDWARMSTLAAELTASRKLPQVVV